MKYEEQTIAEVTAETPSNNNNHDSDGFEAFKARLREKDGLRFTSDDADAARTVPAAWIEKLASGGTLRGPVQINSAIITGDLSLQYTVFKCGLSITESEFRGSVNLSFATFERGVNLRGTRFAGRADFRAAHAKSDFHIPLARFEGDASFEDIYVDEVFSAEGADFRAVDFNRASFSKSALFCGALVEGGDLIRTQFRGDADFSDAVFRGTTFFKGAHFHARAAFARARIESAAFFSCDIPRDPWVRHKTHQLSRPSEGGERGDLLHTTFVGDASFIGAKFQSSAAFSGARFEGKADFRRVEIDGTAMFDPFDAEGREDIFERVAFGGAALFWNAVIKGAARFDSAVFVGRADFEHASIGGSAYFRPARRGGDSGPAPLTPVSFGADASFIDMTVNGSVEFTGVKFKGKADFTRVRIEGRALFTPHAAEEQGVFEPVVFGGEANFRDAYIKSSAQFDGAEFKQDAVFKRLVADGNILFRCPVRVGDETRPPGEGPQRGASPTTFHGKAKFESARVRGNAEFDAARFLKDVTFERAEVGGNVYFRPWKDGRIPVTFKCESVFIGMKVTGDAEFSGALFGGDADFTGLQVGGHTYFDALLHYDDGGDGLNFRHKGLEVNPVEFRREARFTGAHFFNQVDFNQARFKQKAIFTGARGETMIWFRGAVFESHAIFREARFPFLFFERPPDPTESGWLARLTKRLRRGEAEPESETASQFREGVDLRGCTYDRIEIKLRHLVDRLVQVGDVARRRESYDRQPFTQLIKTLRAVGDDRRADFVYLRQRGVERRNTWSRAVSDLKARRGWRAARNFFNYLVDWFFWHAGNYGVQPERLFYLSLALVLFGAFIFSLDGAVKPRETGLPDLEVRVETKAEGPVMKFIPPPRTENLPYFPSAIKFSISQFIPIIDIAPSNKWATSDTGIAEGWWFTFDMYGAIHRLLGAIIVPLLLAAIAAGLYRRVQSAL